MNALMKITEGRTVPIDFQCLINGAAFDATGMTVAAVLHDKNQCAVDVDAEWLTIASATVRISPIDQTFAWAAGPYRFRMQVTDSDGKIGFFPEGDAAVILVASQ